MNIKYDKKADALYIKMKKGVIKKTSKVSDFINLDLDGKGNLIGIEILNFSIKNIKPSKVKSPLNIPIAFVK